MKKLVLFALTALATQAAVDLAPFNGTWKVNPNKSQLAGDTVTLKKAADGMSVLTEGPIETKFRMDGKDYLSPMGYTVSMTETGKNQWAEVMKLNGKPVSNARFELTPDGKTLTVTSEGKKPNGEAFKESARYLRTAGDTGLIGAWRSDKIDGGPQTMIVKTTANDLTMSFPDWQASVTAKFDGKGHPFTGPTVPPGLSMVVRPIDSRSVEIRTDKDGKALETALLQVSADGKTLTQTTTRAGETRKAVLVMDKQ